MAEVRPYQPARGTWRVFMTIAAAFTVLGVLFSSQVWVDYAYGGVADADAVRGQR